MSSMTTGGGTGALGPTPQGEDAGAALAEIASKRRVPGWFVVLWRDVKCRVGMFMVLGFALIALLAPVIAPYAPRETVGAPSLDPTAEFWLGTTNKGEDILSQLIWGAQTSMIVGIVAGVISTIIGLAIGLLAGYRQGIVDDVLSFFINLGLVVPVLPLMVTLASYSPVRGLWLIIIVISVTGWAYGARIKRSQVMTLRTRDYVTAAKLAGDGTWRIIVREIMPNMSSLIVVGFMGAALGAIGGEAGLSFLGLGDPQTTSWGTMLNQASIGGALLIGQWAWLVAPGLALALLITSFTLINFGVDALSNPHLREE
ncbi:peptide/nickel transport system permease protein [Diaminobutyricimonas aerilata]|uniref:Peptide/nickel transport system permease protein n=1 Tax=Diaminobutyricimonas aerilata TaxID=1162967 RepID=A0A2M9CLY7_9MICO|nr:ABC transporter permease [Diaminobutyricimonas aerilata]PJJ72878.1 peptide/nickel transport system permease protein [Diaminobutyricimonas aerilata]